LHRAIAESRRPASVSMWRQFRACRIGEKIRRRGTACSAHNAKSRYRNPQNVNYEFAGLNREVLYDEEFPSRTDQQKMGDAALR
jgi:hypothetical protein